MTGGVQTRDGHGPPATLYVIPGSHACRTGMLLLAHKRVDYRIVRLPTGPHPLLVRLAGFPGSAPFRSLDGGTHHMLSTMDRLGTVPALRYGDRRVQTNLAIARFLEQARPEPPLFPEDHEQRRAVEEAERWGDQVLQMAARRIVFAAALRSLDELHGRGGEGRLGALLSSSDPVRRHTSQIAGRFAFRASPSRDAELLARLPAMLDMVDAWIAAGVLGGRTLNAADLMIAPSLALIAYRRDLRPQIEARPAGGLLERVLPEPRAAAASAPAGARLA